MQFFRIYYRKDGKCSRISEDTQIFDDFTRNTYITIQFEEMGNEIYLYKYKMLKKNNDGITMELIPEN